MKRTDYTAGTLRPTNITGMYPEEIIEHDQEVSGWNDFLLAVLLTVGMAAAGWCIVILWVMR